jgi:phage protein D
MLTPAYRLAIGDRIVDTTDEPRASIVTDLTVALDMETPADRFTLVMGQVGSWRPEREDEAVIALGYVDNGGTETVMTGTVTGVEPHLVTRRVTGHSAAATLLHRFADTVYEAKTAGAIVRDLAEGAGVAVSAADDGIDFPAYVIDGRRSYWRHMRDLADLCGFDLYIDREGGLVFRRFDGGRTVHVFDYGRHVIELGCRRTDPPSDSVEAWGESPTGSEGEEAWGWLTKDFSGSRGRAGSGDPVRMMERPVLRTAAAAQTAADARHTRLRRRTIRGSLQVAGNPAVRLGDAIRVRQAPEDDLNGRFQVRSVTHRITKAGGFTTRIGFQGI